MAITVQNTAVSGFATVLGLAKETTYATAVAPTVFLPIEQGQASVTNKLINRTPIRRSKSQQQYGMGILEATGTIDMRIDPVSCGLLLGLSLGTDTTAASGASATSHTFTMSSQSTATVSIDYGKNSIAQYVGAKFSSLDISGKTGDDLMLKAAFDAQTVSLLTSQSLSPTFTNELPFEMSFATTSTIDGTALDVVDFQVQLKNNNKPMQTTQSGRFARAINELGATVTGSFTVPYSSDFINTLLWG